MGESRDCTDPVEDNESAPVHQGHAYAEAFRDFVGGEVRFTFLIRRRVHGRYPVRGCPREGGNK